MGASGIASRSLILLLAAACGLIAANVYYAQPLAGSIGPAIGLSPEASGLVVTLDSNRLRRGSALDRSSGRPDRKSSAGYGQGCDYMRRAGCGGVVEQRDVVFGCRPAGRAWIGRGANPDPIRISPGAPRDAWNSGRQRNQRSHGGRYAFSSGVKLDCVDVELASGLSIVRRDDPRFSDCAGRATAPANARVEIDLSRAPGLDGETGAEVEGSAAARDLSVFSLCSVQCPMALDITTTPSPSRWPKTSPVAAPMRWPPTSLRGRAMGLSGAPNKRTHDPPSENSMNGL